MNTGFIKVSAVSPRVTVANVEKNLQNAVFGSRCIVVAGAGHNRPGGSCSGFMVDIRDYY